ncbi:hypothetical protein PIB30_081339 [Stylosanthes scabra]|uniref:Uncharacterized protein n=1 Tax=Stylosanthes scabra TaxID=79078 RepID=A0ABU6RSW1_9FABA|nr:hypothetical protein [Stylosanthes scabra]
MIDVEKGEVMLRVHDEHITFHIFKGIQTTSENDQCMRIESQPSFQANKMVVPYIDNTTLKEEHKPPLKSSKTPPMIKQSKKPKEILESKTKGWKYKKIHIEGFTHGQKVLEIQPP